MKSVTKQSNQLEVRQNMKLLQRRISPREFVNRAKSLASKILYFTPMACRPPKDSKTPGAVKKAMIEVADIRPLQAIVLMNGILVIGGLLASKRSVGMRKRLLCMKFAEQISKRETGVL